ncbi:hypothetical protein AX16_009803, partial [Volvariella volvacea WC 439]
MGKLNIAHHKSYHPYRRDNIERVRRDEEEAARKEAEEEGRVMLADAEARIERLRERAGISSSASRKKDKNDDMAILQQSGGSFQTTNLPTTNGHINFFQDLEQECYAQFLSLNLSAYSPAEAGKGVALAPSAQDLNPWYSGRRSNEKVEEYSATDVRRQRDAMRKSQHDPLTSITKQLSSRSSPPKPKYPSRSLPAPPQSSAEQRPEVAARLARESSERQRALELIKRKKQEKAVAMTPSTTYGGDDEYADQYNRRE